MNLQPGPSQSIVELPRLTHSIEQPSPPSPLPLLRLSSFLRPRRSSPSAFLTELFRIMESLAEGRIVPLNARPYISIFRCGMDAGAGKKKNRTISGLCIFHFSLQQPTFLPRNFYISRISSNIADTLHRHEVKSIGVHVFRSRSDNSLQTYLFKGV